jgi:uncharacterized protein DUF3352
MNSMRIRVFITLLLSVLPIVGCGSSTASGPAGASVAPASSELFLTVDTSFESDQWQAVRRLLSKFPDGDKGLDFLFTELSDQGIDFERDVRPALGPETDIVGLDLSGEPQFVGLTKPEDVQKLKDLLAKSDEPVVTRVIEGWTAFAESEAILDRFQQERTEGALAGSTDFTDAFGEVADPALARLYLNGAALQEGLQSEESLPPGALATLLPGGKIPSIALSADADENGVRLQGAAKLAGEHGGLVAEPFQAELPNRVPAGAVVYIGFNDLESQLSALKEFLAQVRPDFDRDLARVEAELGLSLEGDVFPLFSGESALYIRPGLLIPEVTLVTQVDDENMALGTMETLISELRTRVGLVEPSEKIEIAGVPVVESRVKGAPVSVFYAAFDDQLVVTTSRDGIAALREDDNRLADDPGFRDALEAADVPDETTGFAYVNLKDAVANLLGFAEMGGATLPSDLRANLEPLQHLVFYGSKDGRTLKFAGFLAVD